MTTMPGAIATWSERMPNCCANTGALDGASEVVIAQAYYLMHDYEAAIRYLRGMGHMSQNSLELMMRSAYEMHDEATMQEALEQLVVEYNQPKWWSDLLDSAEGPENQQIQIRSTLSRCGC